MEKAGFVAVFLFAIGINCSTSNSSNFFTSQLHGDVCSSTYCGNMQKVLPSRGPTKMACWLSLEPGVKYLELMRMYIKIQNVIHVQGHGNYGCGECCSMDDKWYACWSTWYTSKNEGNTIILIRLTVAEIHYYFQKMEICIFIFDCICDVRNTNTLTHVGLHN